MVRKPFPPLTYKRILAEAQGEVKSSMDYIRHGIAHCMEDNIISNGFHIERQIERMENATWELDDSLKQISAIIGKTKTRVLPDWSKSPAKPKHIMDYYRLLARARGEARFDHRFVTYPFGSGLFRVREKIRMIREALKA